MRKERYNFRKLKRLINDTNDTKDLINMFYFNNKAIELANELVEPDYMMDSYYSLTTLDLLLMTRDAETIDDVYKDLMNEYDYEYAFSMWQNYLYCMGWRG